MTRTKKEPYTFSAAGIILYICAPGAALIPAGIVLATLHLTPKTPLWPVLLYISAVLIAQALLLMKFFMAPHITKGTYNARINAIKTTVIPYFEGTTSTTTPVLATNFQLQGLKYPEAYTPFGNTEFTYTEIRYAVTMPTDDGEVILAYRYLSVLVLSLPRSLPNMFFDSRRNQKSFRYTIDPSQIDHLEGGFDDVFVTYFPMHYEIDARSIISPDVMSAMIDASEFDIEIAGDHIYIVGPLVKQDKIEDMINRGLRIRAALGDHIPAYRDDRLGEPANRQDVAVYGRALRSSDIKYLFCALFLLGIAIFILMLDPTSIANVVNFMMMMVGFFILLGIYIHSLVKRRKASEEYHRNVQK